jgi:hypothetical protein
MTLPSGRRSSGCLRSGSLRSAFAAGPLPRSVASSVGVPWQSWHWIWIAAWYSD